MTDGCVSLKNCLVCNSEVTEIIDLGDQPLANGFLDRVKVDFLQNYIYGEKTFPLKVNACPKCSHLQLSHAVDLPLMYETYLYRSGTTDTYRQYMEWFAKKALSYFKDGCNNVLDIGCNDGTQLDIFKKLDVKTFGVDPAENLYEYSSKNHTVIKDYFNEKIDFGTKFDAVVMQNSFAHQPNPQKFLQDIKKILNDDGLIFIQTSQADMVKNNEFDTIYHEHINFYCTQSMNTLVESVGMCVRDIIKNPIHGISYIFVISKNLKNKDVINQYLQDEKQINSLENYRQWANKILTVKKGYLDLLEQSKGTHLVGYGAAAKGNTFLNFVGKPLDFIIDDNTLKQGKFTPGQHIPIKSITTLEQIPSDEPITFVPLAWNFFDEIKKRIKKVRTSTGDKFIRYFPKAELV